MEQNAREVLAYYRLHVIYANRDEPTRAQDCWNEVEALCHEDKGWAWDHQFLEAFLDDDLPLPLDYAA